MASFPMRRAIPAVLRFALRLGFGLFLLALYSVALAFQLEGVALIVLPVAFFFGTAVLLRVLLARVFNTRLTIGDDGLYVERVAAKQFVPFTAIERVDIVGKSPVV